MGRAGKALRQILDEYGISQYQLSVKMGIDRSNISRWVSEERDPLAEAIYEIKSALQSINPDAASAFIDLYLNEKRE
jgi:transcriptional regulator with XRE-family HTH domain